MSERCWTARVTIGHHHVSATRRPATWTLARLRVVVNAVAPRLTPRPVTTLATSRRRGVPCIVSYATAVRVVEARKVHQRLARARRRLCRRGRIRRRSGSHAGPRRSRTRTSDGRHRRRRPAVRHPLVQYCSSVPSRTVVKSTNTSMDSSITRATRTAPPTTTTPRRALPVCRRTTRAISRHRVLPHR